MYNGRHVYVIVAAAGSGKRMGGGINKQFIEIGGRPVIQRCLEAFEACGSVDGLVVTARAQDIEEFRRLVQGFVKVMDVVPGGSERFESVALALDALKGMAGPAEDDIVLVQDGARPFVSVELIDRVIEATENAGAAIPGVPVKDTIKVVEQAGAALPGVVETPVRDRLRAVQTPQGFRMGLLAEAYGRLADGSLGLKSPTDDASLLECMGVKVAVVPGEANNIKITTPEDIGQGEKIMDVTRMPRTGTGFDVHAFAEDRKLVLGGVEIPYELGLLGHSDADVLIHAIMDALLGATALGDIGRHFPDSDPAYKGISSMKLLEHVGQLLEKEDWRIVNIDATVIAQAPKIAPYIDEMCKRTSEVLKISASQVNIKGTTTEKLGFTGRKEGIASLASATVVNIR